MIKSKLIIIFISLALPILCIGQTPDSILTMKREQHYRQEIKDALNGKLNPFYDTLIPDKETAIAVAEPILFKYYGKQEIKSERPYEVMFIDGY